MAKRTDPFYSATVRLKKANALIARLDKRTKRFFQSVPGTNFVEPDTDGVTQLHKVKLGKPIPESCELAATEALQALRDTLDYVGAAATVASGCRTPTSAKFPFGPDAKAVERDMGRGGKQLPPQIQALFLGFKPYKGGNDPLWALNQMRNAATHRVLIPAVPTSVQVHFPTGAVLSGALVPGALSWCSEWDGTKNEITFARVRQGVRFDHDAKLGVFVSFDEPSIIRGRWAVAVLNEIAAEVGRVLTETKAECRRLGWISRYSRAGLERHG
jgi:hypothetical protein